jgi:16S rRNA processing protein RimM
VLIGKIVGTHGIRGNCRLHSYAETLAIFEPGRRLHAVAADGRRRELTIAQIKAHTRGALIALREITGREQAQALVGANLFVDRSELPEPTDDSHYWIDLIGLRVYSVQGEYLGQLASIIETGSNDVYVVKNNEQEILIPALASVVRKIELDRGRMEVDLPEGL